MYGVLRLVESVDVLPHDMCQFYLDHALRNISVTVRLESSHTKISILVLTFSLKVPSGQIGSKREWYHWIGLEKDINRYSFSTFSVHSWIFKNTSKFWAASCKNKSNLLLVWITVCMCSNRDLFRRTVLKKMWERHQLFFRLWLVSKEFQHSAI